MTGQQLADYLTVFAERYGITRDEAEAAYRQEDRMTAELIPARYPHTRPTGTGWPA